MKPNQPQLPTLTDWTQPITARGNELAAVIAEAQSAGFHAHRMKVSSQALYELKFFRLAGPPENFREPLNPIYAQDRPGIRAVSRETKIYEKTH